MVQIMDNFKPDKRNLRMYSSCYTAFLLESLAPKANQLVKNPCTVGARRDQGFQ